MTEHAEIAGLEGVAREVAPITLPGPPPPTATRFDDFPGVSRARQAGVVAGLAVFAAGVLVPALALAWAALVVAALTAAGVALLHTGGLEPSTFGTAMILGVGGAALALALVAIAPRPPSLDDDVVDLESWSVRHPGWARHPALFATVALVALAVLTTLAGATRSPFFPYPWATIVLVAAVVFVAVVSLIATYRVGRALCRAAFHWASVASYRAGLVTAASVLLGLLGGVAAYQGWTARPVEALADRVELASVPSPASASEAGALALCLGADQVDPVRVADGAAPSCELLPAGDDWPW